MAYLPSAEEKSLVEGCLQNRQADQKRLYEKYYGKMLGVCMRYAVDREEAKDILQDGFIKVFQNMASFAFNCPLEAWVRRIMVNTSIDKYRRNIHTQDTRDIETAGEVAVQADVFSNMAETELLSYIHAMPAGYRIVFNMYVLEGYSHKEISETLNISEGTSKSQLSKAKNYLQKIISKQYSH